MVIEVGRRAVHAEQHDRGGADQMGEAPPADGANRHVLRPDEQQQQAEDRLHIDRHHEQGVDVESHQSYRLPVTGPRPVFRPVWALASFTNRAARKRTGECGRLPARPMRRYGFEDLSETAAKSNPPISRLSARMPPIHAASRGLVAPNGPPLGSKCPPPARNRACKSATASSKLSATRR